MDNRLFTKRHLAILISFIVVILFPAALNGQDCPTFEIQKITDTSNGADNGSIEIKIESSKVYKKENFEIRQKKNQVTGTLGYNVEILISKNQLTINGLKKSQDMYLSEYLIRFSDKACNNGRLMEVGIFKIR